MILESILHWPLDYYMRSLERIRSSGLDASIVAHACGTRIEQQWVEDD